MAAISYVLPFCLYLLPAMLEPSDSQSATYMLICTLKGLLATGALILFRKSYPKFSPRGFGLAVAGGIVGFGVWIGLVYAQSAVPAIHNAIISVQGTRAGFNPFADGSPTPLQIAFTAVRLLELVIVVPLVEEIFWRGFLSRYLISDDFEKVPEGVFTTTSFLVVSLMFAAVHPEVFAAFAWGSLVNLIYIRTMNIWACVLTHSVTNAILGVFVLTNKAWYLW